MITLSQVPGYVDVPDSLLDAGDFALGLLLQRMLGNTKFGLVRPEFFIGTYTNGQTVDLPTSPIDGYTYERDELAYLWSYGWTGGTGDGKIVTGKGSMWYFGANVDQTTGVVSSFIKYRESGSAQPQMTNDGWLNVTTIGVRRKTSLIATNATWGGELFDASFAQDKPFTTSLAKKLNANAKAAVLGTEAIYMGEFIHGQQIPQPISPVDGHVYAYSECTFAYAWRWTTDPNNFVDPLWVNIGGVFGHVGLNQLHRIAATIDATGNVSLDVVHYDDGEQATHNGRITVVALCKRAMTAITEPAAAFTDLIDAFFDSGQPLRFDILQLLNRNAKFAACRPEIFSATYTNGQIVPVPTSSIDGYVYARNELFYFCEFATTNPATDIRIHSYAISVEQTTGRVQSNINRLHDGGRFVTTSDGTVRVWTIGLRGHESASNNDPALVEGGNAAPEGTLSNGSFDRWSLPSQLIADDWKQIPNVAGAGATFSHEPGIDPGGSAQGIAADNTRGGGVRSLKLAVKQGQRKTFLFSTMSDVAIANGFFARVTLMNELRTSSCSFDLYGNAPMATTPKSFLEWCEIPAKNATTANTSKGAVAIAGTLDFFPAWAFLDFYNWVPNVASKITVDSVVWTDQVDTANGGVGSRGSIGLAFFPAIPISWTDTTASFDLSNPLQRNDGSSTPTGVGTLTVTGLTPSTQYAVEFYYDEIDKIIKAAGAGSGHGAPYNWCFLPSELTRALAVEWGDVAHLPLSEGPIYFTTNASPTDPGGGGFGGGDGGCHREDVFVLAKSRGIVMLKEVRPGDLLWDGRDRWTEVESVARRQHSDWIHIDFAHGVQNLPVTSGHTFETIDGELIRAFDLSMQSELWHPGGRTSPLAMVRQKYDGWIAAVRCKAPHTFLVSRDRKNWVRSHNNNRLISTL